VTGHGLTKPRRDRPELMIPSVQTSSAVARRMEASTRRAWFRSTDAQHSRSTYRSQSAAMLVLKGDHKHTNLNTRTHTHTINTLRMYMYWVRCPLPIHCLAFLGFPDGVVCVPFSQPDSCPAVPAPAIGQMKSLDTSRPALQSTIALAHDARRRPDQRVGGQRGQREA
jgi:hypothetical protein